tara:strand:- start:2045 stop:2425 length:381 start_codon:yes stop_codon:yes gene_type:complete
MATSVNLDISKRVDIVCRKGNTFNLELLIKDALGVVIDVSTPTVYTFKMEVRETDTSAATIIDTSAAGFTITGTNLGVVEITTTAAIMAAVNAGLFVYDFQATKASDSSVQTWLYGTFRVNEDVTV